jgi:prophage DNA circulation protein
MKDDTILLLGALGVGAFILYKPLSQIGEAAADTLGGVGSAVSDTTQGLGRSLTATSEVIPKVAYTTYETYRDITNQTVDNYKEFSKDAQNFIDQTQDNYEDFSEDVTGFTGAISDTAQNIVSVPGTIANGTRSLIEKGFSAIEETGQWAWSLSPMGKSKSVKTGVLFNENAPVYSKTASIGGSSQINQNIDTDKLAANVKSLKSSSSGSSIPKTAAGVVEQIQTKTFGTINTKSLKSSQVSELKSNLAALGWD